MGLLFKSRRRRSAGGGLVGLLVIGGALYYTGMLPAAWDHIKNAGNHCYAALSGIGVGGQSVCGAVNGVVGMIDRSVSGMGNEFSGWMGETEQQFNDSSNGLMQQVNQLMGSFSGSGLTSGERALASIMQRGPAGLQVGAGDMAQLRGAMDSFAISQQLMRSEPSLSMEWMQKGASMGAYGMPSQLSLGNVYAQSGNNAAAAVYYQQALGSLQALQGSQSPAAQQMLGGMNVSPAVLTQQITAAIKQMQIGR